MTIAIRRSPKKGYAKIGRLRNCMGKRIEYLDAMRGLTMTLVVIGHIFAYCMNHGNIINTELTNLRLPLFFFVSGFLVYKNDLVWNFRNMYSFLQKKFRQQ